MTHIIVANRRTIMTSSTPANRPAESLVAQLSSLLIDALKDAAVLEVRTFTSQAADAELANPDDPLSGNARLRAFSRIAMDGDTRQCIPLAATGEPDKALWELHQEAVAQARRDRAASLETAIAALKELGRR
jgi:hypothetical protein